MRLALRLRRVSDMCRSSTRAAPRAVARDSPVATLSTATGESLAKLMLMELRGSSGTSCASKVAAPRNPNSASRIRVSIRINVIDRYVARFGIHVASPHGALRAHRVLHVLGAGVQQAERLAALSHLNSICHGLYHDAIVAGGARPRMLQNQ